MQLYEYVPVAHGPLSSNIPLSAQYRPAVQSRHSETFSAPLFGW